MYFIYHILIFNSEIKKYINWNMDWVAMFSFVSLFKAVQYIPIKKWKTNPK